jgi:hypothetical protein
MSDRSVPRDVDAPTDADLVLSGDVLDETG